MTPAGRSLVIGTVVGLLAILFMLVLGGCATTGRVVEKCAPAAPQVVDVVANALSGAEYEATLTSIGLDVGMCVLREAVDMAIHMARTTKFAGGVDAMVIVKHGQAWKATHPE